MNRTQRKFADGEVVRVYLPNKDNLQFYMGKIERAQFYTTPARWIYTIHLQKEGLTLFLQEQIIAKIARPSMLARSSSGEFNTINWSQCAWQPSVQARYLPQRDLPLLIAVNKELLKRRREKNGN